MKYKLRGDYAFKTAKNEILRNKRDADGNVLESVVLDDKIHAKEIAEQMHMLEPIVEKKNEAKVPVVPPEQPKEPVNTTPPEQPKNDQSTNTKQGNTEQKGPAIQSGSGSGIKGK